VVGVLSGGEGGVHYLRPVDPNGFAVAQSGNNQQQQIITLPITVPGKDGTQQQQTVQIQVVNPSVSQSGNSGDQPKYHLAPISLSQFPQGAATVLTVACGWCPNSSTTAKYRSDYANVSASNIPYLAYYVTLYFA